jgi:hypothetical protein
MEKVEKLGEVTAADRLRWKYVPEGEKMALRFLSDEANLVAELAKYDGKAREHVVAGAQKILLGRIDLVRNDAVKRTNKKAMEGLKLLKKDTIAVENIFSQMRSLFNFELEQGEQQRQQAYESLKAQFEDKLKKMGPQAAEAQAAVEEQFRQELRQVLAQIDVQYINQLDAYKQELETVD